MVCKKIISLVAICTIIFPVLQTTGQSWNPYVAQGVIAPAPLLPFQFNGTGVISFNVGNTGSDSLLYFANNPPNNVKLSITLSRGVPNVTPLNPSTALTTLGGSWVSKFTWVYDMALNKFTGTQNQDIPPLSQGSVTVLYKVTQNSLQSAPLNGFSTVLTPPAYTTGINSTSDDMVSSFTYTDAKDFGDAPVSYGSADHKILVDDSLRLIYFGSLIDPDTANQPSPNADNDDLTGIDDEDGIIFNELLQGFNSTIQISVIGLGRLNSWVDWNGDGDFIDGGERLAQNIRLEDETYNLLVAVPIYAIVSQPTFIRFRFGPMSTINPQYGSSGTASYGEVEDYKVSITPLIISGTVLNDANGMLNNLVDGTGTNASGNIFINLVRNADNIVIGSLPVNSDGTFSFGTSQGVLPNTSYKLILTSVAQTPGNILLNASFPVNWVPTGEILGTGTGNDGTVDGKLSVNTNSGFVSNARFGLDQLPVSDDVSAALMNPGGTAQATVPVMTGYDPEDGPLGAGSSIRITSLPANGTLKYNGIPVVPNQVITNYNPSLLTVDPANGTIVLTFTYLFYDAAFFPDPTPATVTLTFTDLTVSGNVYDDTNGMFDNLVNGTGTNASGNIYMNLVKSAGNLVVFSTLVNNDGTFMFGTSEGVIANNSYNLIITSSVQTLGNILTTATFPSNWVPTGEILGTGTGNDGNVNGILAIAIGTGNLTNANFGLDQLPNSNDASATYTNPGGTNQVMVPLLTGSDPEEGPLGYGSTIVITLLPSNGTLYYNASPVLLHQVISNYDPVKLTVDPENGTLAVIFEYAFQDMAWQQDPTPAAVIMTFNDLSISGNIYDDGNGMTNGFVDGAGSNASGMLYVNLVKSVNDIVVFSLPVNNDGSYTFGTNDGLLNVTDYTLIITSNYLAMGTILVSASYPVNWVSTGEKLGAGQGNDGNTNGMLSVNTNTGSVSDANFGLDQLPQADDITGTHLNPGGNSVMIVPTLSGTDPEDGLLGPGNTFTINTLASNGTLYYQGVPVVLNQVITNYSKEQLTLDPIDGTPVVTFNYTVIDSAGFQDPSPATITITFTLIPYADLSVKKTDSTDHFVTGKDIVYAVVVKNAWNDAANGAMVTDITPAGTTMSWIALFSGGATGNASGTGDISETVNLPGGSKIIYTVTISVPCNFTGNIVNTASVEVPEGITDPDMTNNAATDADLQNIWTGSVSDNWNAAGNWTLGIPDTATLTGATIPGGLPVYPVIYDTAMTAASLVIADGASLTIKAGKDLYIDGCSSINGTNALYLKSDKMSGHSSFITSQHGSIMYPNSGSVKLDLFLEKCPYSQDCSFYISSPLSDAQSGVFAGDSLRSYKESNGSFGPFITGTNEPLNVMEGYMLSNSVDETRTFEGRLNDSTITELLTYTPGKGNGWNLAGNPYPSYIDLFTTLDWSNVDKVIYPYDHISGNYKPFPFMVGFGLSNRYIPSMTGFFVHVSSVKSSGILSFTDENRTGIRTPTSRIELPGDLLWLKAEGNGSMYDEAIVYFRNDVITGYDQDIDCYKLEGAATAPQLSSISSDDISLAINALPVDSLDHNIIVPLEFYVPDKISGEYSISASKIESFTGGTNIWLEDKKTDTLVFLNNNPVYSFNYSGNDDPARFSLHFHFPHFGIDNKSDSEKLLIYSCGKDVYLKDLSGNPEKGRFFLYNMIGQEIACKPVKDIPLNKYSFNLPNGYYIIRVITRDIIYNSKVFID